MQHLKKHRKFGRERDQRRALMKSLASSFFIIGKIKTTEAKAKELRPYVEKFITKAKVSNLDVRRKLADYFTDKASKKILEYGEVYKNRPGGYTRITKIGARKRDSARMAILELVK